MSPLHPALLELRTELERQGFVVVCHGDYVCVRLPLTASVRIRLDSGQLRLEPRFAAFSRGTSLVITPVIAVLGVVGMTAVAPVIPVVVAAFAGTVMVLHDIARLIMTEGAMTRLQLLWSTRQAPREIPGAAPGDPASIAFPSGTGMLPNAAMRPGADITPRSTKGRLRIP